MVQVTVQFPTLNNMGKIDKYQTTLKDCKARYGWILFRWAVRLLRPIAKCITTAIFYCCFSKPQFQGPDSKLFLPDIFEMIEIVLISEVVIWTRFSTKSFARIHYSDNNIGLRYNEI